MDLAHVLWGDTDPMANQFRGFGQNLGSEQDCKDGKCGFHRDLLWLTEQMVSDGIRMPKTKA